MLEGSWPAWFVIFRYTNHSFRIHDAMPYAVVVAAFRNCACVKLSERAAAAIAACCEMR